jgi:hypothetical protein
LAWLEEQIARVPEALERRTAQSAVLLRKLLGEIRLEPVTPEGGRPYYRAKTNLDVLALIENEPDSGGPESGSTALRWWTRSQSVRTACEIPLVVNLLETSPAPTYQRIAFQVRHLRRLGLTYSAIANVLRISDKTVAKAATWELARSERSPDVPGR